MKARRLKPELRRARARFAALVWRALVTALVLNLILPVASAQAATSTYYLRGNVGDHPGAAMSGSAPAGGSLPNYDPSRDAEPGLLLQKGGSGAGESDPVKHQIWIAPAGALDLSGPASFTFWSAIKDFSSDKAGEMEAYLLDCTPSGTGCSTIASGSRYEGNWSSSGTWRDRTINFGSVSHSVPAGRSLAIKIVVGGNSEDDMWFAYNTTSYSSRLELRISEPPPTTTTTTTLPPTTTTTTTNPSTTTTIGQTSSPAGSSTTIRGQVTTTTAEDRGDDTAAGAFDRAEPPPPQAATSALPSTGADSPDDVTDSTASLEILAAAGTPVVGSLIHGLEIVLPPEVATALASPLIVVELLLGALLDSGGAVLIPSLLLSLVVASILTPGPGVISLGTRWRRTRGVGHSSSEQLSSPGGAR